MYTQCPECGTAFRVTAEVLKRAAGKVRCGGCGSAFNALDFLSEHKPVTPVPPVATVEPPAPAPDPPRLEADEPPLSISAERSAALLKTLDELAGSDIRIEDTGIEWRLLGADDDEDPEEMDDTGSMRWFIDESPTPVDEQLSAEPGEIDAPEIFEPRDAPGGTAEMRFDDDTPLPEDYDFDSEPAESGPAAEIEVREEPVELDTAQVDLELGEPEDWEDLLGEVAADDEPRKAEQPAATAEEQEDEPLPDVDTQFATQAEAMGIDLSGVRAQAAPSEALRTTSRRSTTNSLRRHSKPKQRPARTPGTATRSMRRTTMPTSTSSYWIWTSRTTCWCLATGNSSHDPTRTRPWPRNSVSTTMMTISRSGRKSRKTTSPSTSSRRRPRKSRPSTG